MDQQVVSVWLWLGAGCMAFWGLLVATVMWIV